MLPASFCMRTLVGLHPWLCNNSAEGYVVKLVPPYSRMCLSTAALCWAIDASFPPIFAWWCSATCSSRSWLVDERVMYCSVIGFMNFEHGQPFCLMSTGLTRHHRLGEQHLLNYLSGARSSERVQAHVPEHLGCDFKVLLLLFRQVRHGGLDHVLSVYV
jgi:hypothetical protein